MSLQITLKINTVDLTSSMMERDWFIRDHFGTGVDVCEVVLDDPNNAISIVRDQELTIQKSDLSATYFGGIVADIHYSPFGLGRRIRVVARDYKMLLDRYTINKHYTNSTDTAIITNMFTVAGLTEVDTSGIGGGKTIPAVTFRGHTLRQAMDIISSITGLVWDVDNDKNLIYRREGSANPPSPFFAFSDAPDDVNFFPYRNLTYSQISGDFNVVEIHGGAVLSADTTDIYSGNGARTLFTLGEQAGTSKLDRAPSTASRIIIEYNSGTDGAPIWTGLTVGIEGLDSNGVGGITALWNPITLHVTFNTAPPNFTNSWRVTGRNIGPLAIVVKNTEHISSHNNREYKKVLDGAEFTSEEDARLEAVGFLRDHDDREELEFDVEYDGIEVGDSLRIISQRYGLTGLNGVIMVWEMEMSLIGGQLMTYHIKAGNRPYGYAQMVRKPKGMSLTLPGDPGDEGTRESRAVQGIRAVTGRTQGASPTLVVTIYPYGDNVLYENYITQWNTGNPLFADEWWAQTFTPSVDHRVVQIKMLLLRSGTPGTLTVSIRAVDGDSKPTGADLASGTYNGNTISDAVEEWVTVPLTITALLSSGVKYAIVARAAGVDTNNSLDWKLDGTGNLPSGFYTGGEEYWSVNAGVAWTAANPRHDFMFEEWGNLGQEV